MLPPEIESGNKEYKLKIVPDDSFRLEQLASQMKWRIDEGEGIAYYYLGVSDNGETSGISQNDYNQSMKNLSLISKKINANITKIENFRDNNRYWYIITVKYNFKDNDNARIIFIGSSGSGKTTLISNIVNNTNDNGKGKSRKLVFNHKHEIYSGTTSSISIEKKKFNLNSNLISFNLIDTPGLKKFIKTTITCLCKYRPNKVVLCIDPSDVNIKELDFFLQILRYFRFPFLIVFSKKDKYKSFHKTFLLKNILELVGKEFNEGNSKFVPYIEISNITKSGYKKLIQNIKSTKAYEIDNNLDIKFQICDIIKIPNIGRIYTGILLEGKMEANKSYLITNSEFESYIDIKSIHFMDKPYNLIDKNKLVTFTITNEIELCNKTDKLLVERKLKRYSKFLIKCKKEISSNNGLCIYNNQYFLANIKKINRNIYEIYRKEGFINLSDKIILKVNDEYYFTYLVDSIL